MFEMKIVGQSVLLLPFNNYNLLRFFVLSAYSIHCIQLLILFLFQYLLSYSSHLIVSSSEGTQYVNNFLATSNSWFSLRQFSFCLYYLILFDSIFRYPSPFSIPFLLKYYINLCFLFYLKNSAYLPFKNDQSLNIVYC